MVRPKTEYRLELSKLCHREYAIQKIEDDTESEAKAPASLVLVLASCMQALVA